MKKLKDLSNVTDDDIKRFEPIVFKIIGSNSFCGNLSMDEKYSAGLLGIAAALSSFDPSRKTSLESWVYKNIFYAIRDEGRDSQRYKSNESPYFPEDDACDNQNNTDVLELMDFVEFASKSPHISDRDRRVIKNLFLDCKSQIECAEAENISQSTISRTKNRILKILQESANQ